MAEVRRSNAPPDEVFYIQSVFRREPIDSLLLLYSIISSKWPLKADSSLKLNVPEKTLKPITKLKKTEVFNFIETGRQKKRPLSLR